MGVKTAINGFGRIGSLTFRAGLENMAKEIDFVAINDPFLSADYMAYMLKFDSVHGRFEGHVQSDGENLIVNGKKVRVFCETDPEKLPWGEVGADYVIDATGKYTSRERAEAHLRAGAKYVVISAPAPDAPMFVVGVNENEFIPEMKIVSNASCTTNCLAPLAKIVNDEFGIENGLMTTVHAATASQRIVDGVSSKDWRGGRSAAGNIIPSTTGAAKAVGRVIPELNGKLTGMSMRIPSSDVSVVDLTVNLRHPTTYRQICDTVRHASREKYIGIVDYTEEPVVSSDFVGDPHTCIFDAGAGLALTPTFMKLVAWYDNEWGYSNKMLELVKHMDSKIKS